MNKELDKLANSIEKGLIIVREKYKPKPESIKYLKETDTQKILDDFRYEISGMIITAITKHEVEEELIRENKINDSVYDGIPKDTTIKISKDSKDKLDKLKLIPRESYEQVITRLFTEKYLR